MTNIAAQSGSSVDPDAERRLTLRIPVEWEHAQLDDAHVAETVDRLARSLEGLVDRPAKVAAAAVPAFAKRVAAGCEPIVAAWFSQANDEGAVLGANLIAVRSRLTGDLDRWQAYLEGSERLTMPIGEVLRIAELAVVDTGDLVGKISTANWKYVISMDADSAVLLSFSTANVAVKDVMGDWFDRIVATAEWSPLSS